MRLPDYQHVARQIFRYSDNISSEVLEMRDIFTWFPLHKDSIAWKTFHDSQILWLCCSGHCPPTAGRQGCLCCLERFHIRLLVWSLKIRPSMLENVCLNLENTFPKLPTVVTCSVKMQETLQLLTRQSIWHWVKEAVAPGSSRQASAEPAEALLFSLLYRIPARAAGQGVFVW